MTVLVSLPSVSQAVLLLLLLLAVLTPALIPGRKVEAASHLEDWEKAS